MPADLTLLHFIGLPLLGIVVGAFGTFLGIGGGLILVPVLLLLFPADSPSTVTSIALAVVFLNALSGTAGYLREKRVDLRSGALFALAALPGSIAGALAIRLVDRRFFEAVLGLVMALAAFYLFWRSLLQHRRVHPEPEVANRTLTDAHGTHYRYRVSERLGVAVSTLVGFVSSFLGIGGGIIHVPAMVLLLRMPAAISTATSQFVLVFTALAGTTTHVVSGQFETGWRRTGLLGLGVLLGAQLGVVLARRARPRMVMLLLAVVLFVAGVRQLLALLG